ncbi:hypothetical protein CMO93_00915 [Candidatus Woesearchaeota archaeon]|nr:hypothetical protein [Candidatus Woesearchaeota archaeon]|tara:strand:+ start:423 stop:671 length:249 start_codon:yes stop_codon:yes gene_type:complete
MDRILEKRLPEGDDLDYCCNDQGKLHSVIGYINKTEFFKYYLRLKERGKHPRKCLVATARKLEVQYYYDLLKYHEPKDLNSN